jgi:RNA polymerase sigma factor (sigma-70 family)
MTPIFSSALLRAQSDERLLRLVREGQERAFDAIVDRYRKPLQCYCERALSRSRAEDVVQQVLMNAWLALRDGTDVRSLRPWLYRIARTTMLDNAEAPGYDYAELERSLLSPDGPESELEQLTVVRRTLSSLAALPDSQREALLRTAFDGQSRAQIAGALGVTEGAVRQLLYRARASLRAAATAVTPLPLVSWLATAGSGSAAGTALEGGATGSIGIAGIAKASAVLATAGVVVTGSGGVRNGAIDGAKKARAETAKVAVVHRQQAKVGALVQARPAVARARPIPNHSPDGGNQGSREADHGDSQARDGGGDSGESARSSGDGEHQTALPEGQRRDQPQADQPAPPEGGDSKPAGDQGDPPPPPDSGSGDNGD